VNRIYLIWNRAYKSQMVIASSPEEAVAICMKKGHFKRISNYRKFEDQTEGFLERDDLPNIRKLLESGVSGYAELTDLGWLVDGEQHER
jgi:hypothetical protein